MTLQKSLANVARPKAFMMSATEQVNDDEDRRRDGHPCDQRPVRLFLAATTTGAPLAPQLQFTLVSAFVHHELTSD